VLEAVALPPGVVTLGSRVELKDLSDSSVDVYTLVMPERADSEQGRLSILAPIGTAILGYAQGDEFAWKTPGGQRRLLIVSVTREADDGPKLPSVLS
jgi:regulator of nucleoside diphosphate kinase